MFIKRGFFKLTALRLEATLIQNHYKAEKKYLISLRKYYKQQSEKFKVEALQKIEERSWDRNYFISSVYK